MKNSIIALFIGIISISQALAQPAYFGKKYGNSGEINTPQKVKGISGHTFVLSARESAVGKYAVFSKFTNAGVLVWEYRYSFEAVLNDFESDSAGTTFLLVGATEPSTIGGTFQDNKSLLVILSDLGSTAILNSAQEFDHTGNESFTEIIRHPNPVNAGFPYYVQGFKNLVLPPSFNTQPMMYNFNIFGTPNFQVEYSGGGTPGNEIEGHFGLFTRANGNVIFVGETAPGNQGLLVQVNGSSGGVVSSWRYNSSTLLAKFDLYDGIELPNGDFIVVGNDFATNEGVLIRLNPSLSPLSYQRFSNIGAIREIGRDGTGRYYITAVENSGSNRPIVMRLTDDLTTVSVDYAATMNDSETAFSSPRISVTPFINQIFYADARQKTTDLDLLVGAFDLSFDIPSSPIACRTLFPTTLTANLGAVGNFKQIAQKITLSTITQTGLIDTVMMACTPFCTGTPGGPCMMPPICNTIPDVTLNTDPGLCAASHTFTASGTGCDTLRIRINLSGATTGSYGPFVLTTSLTAWLYTNTLLFNKGITNVAITVTDGMLNSCFTGFRVTVNDNQPPIIVCPNTIFATGIFCDGGAIVTLPPPVSLTDNCPMVTYTYSEPPSGFYQCGTVRNVVATATDMSGLTSTCNFNVVMDCPCAAVGAGTITCDSLIDDKYSFSIPITSLGGSVSCTATVSATGTGYTVMSVPLTFTSSGILTGMIQLTGTTIPPVFDLKVTVVCVCATGLSQTCMYNVPIASTCCREITLPNLSFCADDPTADVPLLGCGVFSSIYLVNYYIATGAICPPFSGASSPGWFLAQSSTSCLPLTIFPNLFTSDKIWVVAEMTAGDGPCTFLISNIATISLCKKATCTAGPYQEYCYTGTPITPATLTAIATPTSTFACKVNFGEWLDPTGASGLDGDTFTPNPLSLPAGYTDCYMDFLYTATVESECGSNICTTTIRLFNNDATIGSLAMNPFEPQPFCPGEDATLQFLDHCTSHPPMPGEWTWESATAAAGPYTALPDCGLMNPLWNTNQLFVDTWYRVTAENGVCPAKETSLMIDVRDPFFIVFYSATPDVTPPTCDYKGVDFVIDLTGIDATCPAIIHVFKNGIEIHTFSTTSATNTWTYIDAALMGDYSGNYWIEVERTCCGEIAASSLTTIEKPRYAVAAGPCTISAGMTGTLVGELKNPKTGVTCVSQWYELILGTTLVGIGAPDQNTVMVSDSGIYVYQVVCADGCIYSDTVYLGWCTSDCVYIPPFKLGVPTDPEIQNDFAYYLYPNPTSGAFRVEWSELVHISDGRISIYSGLGQLVHSWKIPNGQHFFDVQTFDLPSGIYFVKLESITLQPVLKRLVINKL
jgi:hypothetical protein